MYWLFVVNVAPRWHCTVLHARLLHFILGSFYDSSKMLPIYLSLRRNIGRIDVTKDPRNLDLTLLGTGA